MKLTWGILPLLLLTGCTTPPAPVDHDAAFITAISEKLPTAGTQKDAMIALAHSVCDDFKSGSNQARVLAHLQQASPDVPAATWGTLVGASTAAYCPEFSL